MPEFGSKGAKSGSNVRHRSLAVARGKEIAARVRLLERAAQIYRRACARLLSKKDVRTAAAVAARVTREMHRENLKGGSQAADWSDGRTKARTKLERELARALRGYRRWKKLAGEYRREREKLERAIAARLAGPRLHVDLTDVLPPDSGDTRVFEAPFTVYDLFREDSSVVVTDRSFVVPSIGHLINNVDFEQRDDGPIATDFYGINWPGRLFSSAACGVNFTTPRAGRLRVGAALQNFHNRITCSLQDQFGFSEADLSIEVRLVISIVQPGRVTTMRQPILTGGLTSFGKDLAYALPLLDTTALHVIEATTAESYASNTGLQILAGCELFVLSEIDDMRSYVDALLWWQLKKLTVDVI